MTNFMEIGNKVLVLAGVSVFGTLLDRIFVAYWRPVGVSSNVLPKVEVQKVVELHQSLVQTSFGGCKKF